MRRSVTEKGIQAERWHIHLGFINGLRGDELFRYARNAARQTDSDWGGADVNVPCTCTCTHVGCYSNSSAPLTQAPPCL